MNVQNRIKFICISDERLCLGDGHFGAVYKGSLINPFQVIAVKTLKTECSLQALKNLLNEIKIMSFVGEHDNILKLIGAHTSKIDQGNLS